MLGPLGQEASLGCWRAGDRAWRERVAREAGGNPFFLGELARVAGRAGEALPDTVLAAVALEVAALAPAARALIEGAAVAGDPFDPELAAAAAGVAPTRRARQLVAADLVRANARPGLDDCNHPTKRARVSRQLGLLLSSKAVAPTLTTEAPARA